VEALLDQVQRAVGRATAAAWPSDDEINIREQLVFQLMAQHEVHAARPHLAWVLQVRPTSWRLHLYQAEIWLRDGRSEDAASSAAACLSLMEGMEACEALLGLALSDLGRWEDALPPLQRAWRSRSTDEQLLERLARALLQTGQPDQALDLLQERFVMGQDTLQLRLLAGAAGEQARRWSEARRHYDWVAETHRNPEVGRRYLAEHLRRAMAAGLR
jgi:predicted Zn-dependent protease